MKRNFFLLIGLISFSILKSQNMTDALRYSNENVQGSARFSALSGAFGALGGDLSAISINPAGSSIFLDNTIGVSFAAYNKKNQNTYFNNVVENTYSDFDINQIGAVFVWNNRDENSDWKKFTFGINFNTQNNFNNEFFVVGNNNQSLGDFFLSSAQGVPLDLLQLRNDESISDLYAYLGETEGTSFQNAFLGYQAYIFDPLEETPSNTAYISNFGTGTYEQDYAFASNGYTGKYSFNISTQFKDQYYFGINFNAHTIDYRHSTFLRENNSNNNSSIKNIYFENNLAVLGNGFSIQLGAIAKLHENIRVGLTFDSPTWLTISEETTQYLESTRVENNDSFSVSINPKIINVFSDYRLSTPGKISASGAYVFGKSGFISLDYSYKDYASIKFRPSSDAYFQSLNNTITNALKGASTIKLGGEYRVQQLSFRAGLHFSESPYQDKSILDDSQGYSLGIGFNFGNYNLDAAYVRTQQSSKNEIFNSGLTTPYSSTENQNNFLITLGINL
ncbi:MAG: transporter [Flavobacteriaceae bacterium]|nr:transporter [Flavobacteriaceae bacterium]